MIPSSINATRHLWSKAGQQTNGIKQSLIAHRMNRWTSLKAAVKSFFPPYMLYLRAQSGLRASDWERRTTVHDRSPLLVPPIQVTETIKHVGICLLHGFIKLELVAPAEGSDHHRLCVVHIQISCPRTCEKMYKNM